MKHPVYNGRVIQSFALCLSDILGNLKNLSGLWQMILEEELYKEFEVERTGAPARFETVEEFLAARIPTGVESERKVVELLCDVAKRLGREFDDDAGDQGSRRLG